MLETGRSLLWEHAFAEERFGCSECSWTFPNPQAAAQGEHDFAVVKTRFDRHRCDFNSKKLSPYTSPGASV
jgi:hypothetical protein